MSGISSRIDRLLATLNADSAPVDVTDTELAHRLDHILAGVIQCGHEPDKHQLAIANLLVNDGDGAAWLKGQRKLHAEAHENREAARKADTGRAAHPGSSINEFMQLISVPVVAPSRPLTRGAEIVSLEFERERAENLGKAQMVVPRQTQAITRWKR
jgi:hypothetical protein